ncbi:MAG: SUMF1/EgtB/PvdO family nonheme iron enzyme [Thermoguttaceae bacterium]|nr:SUMF1/EgtB/PvdO family nonheme iron enzyme [Thermoguttaceae bacterium]
MGQKKPNEWGRYDTIGNVWERVQDWADGYSKDDVVDPTGPPDPLPYYQYKIRRGGGAFCCPEFCRAAFRIRDAVDERHKFWGGRIVLLPYSV